MLSIEKCRTILMQENYELDNDEIKLLREFLYLFAEIQINAEKELLKNEECNTIL